MTRTRGEPAGCALSALSEAPISLLPLALALSFVSCKDKGDDTTAPSDDTGSGAESVVDAWCPGMTGCEDADGALSVGDAALTITPPCFESWEDTDGDWEYDDATEPFLDCGCDRLCEGDDGYAAPDEGESDGEFQAVWMAGFNNGMPAQYVHDDLWSRAIVFDQGSTRIALVMVDLVGFFRDDVLLAREALAATDAGVDFLVVASTHVHEGPDTMGLWGETESQSGVNPEYNAWVRDRIVAAVQDATADLRLVATMTVGAVDMSTYHADGVHNVLTDLRDPVVIDEMMRAARFADASGATIATLAHMGDHPESLADENTSITSDVAHGLREVLESGSTWDAYSRDGLGGTAIFVDGAVGGMMSSLRVDTEDPDGTVWDAYTYDRTVAIGRLFGEMALDAIDSGQTADAPSITLATRRFRLPVHNYGFQAMFLTEIITRDLYDYDPSKAITADNTPWVETEIDLLQVGPIRMLTIPGELFPKLNIGGYDGSHVCVQQGDRAVLVGLQCAAVSVALYLTHGMAAYGFDLPLLMDTTMLIGFSGMALGLLVSAVWTWSEAAVGTLPLLLIPQITLAGVMVSLKDMNVFAKGLSWVAVQRYAFEAVVKCGATYGNPNPRIPGEWRNESHTWLLFELGFKSNKADGLGAAPRRAVRDPGRLGNPQSCWWRPSSCGAARVR